MVKRSKKMSDIFAESANTTRTYSAFFEADDVVGWYYLVMKPDEPDSKIICAMQIMHGIPDFAESDLDVRWTDDDMKVGVFIKSKLYGYYDLNSWRSVPGIYPSKPLEW